jgi:AAHS family 4-hydroxybenzoate transporter-like MFS transporter
VLFLTFFGAAVCVALLGQVRELALLMGSSFAAGFFVIGGQIALNAFVGRYYPARVRATGVGWALGIGRVGGIIGPILGSVFLTLALPTATLFLLAALPPAVAAVAIVFVRTKQLDAVDDTLKHQHERNHTGARSITRS